MTTRPSSFAGLAETEGEPLLCPECGSDALGTVEALEGISAAKLFRVADQVEPEIDHSGDTEIGWDASNTVGIQCRSCYWECRDDNWPTLLRTRAELDGASE